MSKNCNFKNIQNTLLSLLNNRKFKDKPQYIYFFAHLLTRVDEDNKVRFILLEWVKETSFLTERILRKAVAHLEEEMIISTIKEGNKKFIKINNLYFNECVDTVDNMNESGKKVMKKTAQLADIKWLSVESSSKKVMNNDGIREKKVMSDLGKNLSQKRGFSVSKKRFDMNQKVEWYDINGRIIVENEEKTDKNEQTQDKRKNIC
jgi:hypothetical protein